MMRRTSARSRGFTLLETVVAMAILTLALMAIFDLNSGAVMMHTYAKKVTVATLLARAKMTDLEQDLYDKGFPADDEDRSGDFSEDGWSSFKWRAKIIAPKTSGVSTDQLLSAVFGLPAGGGDPLSALMGGGAGGKDGKAAAAGLPPGATPGMSGLAGAAGGMAQAQMTQFLDQIRATVREVHLTVTWRDGKQVESVDLVTHVISGSERNGSANAQAQAGQPNANGAAPGTGPGGLPFNPVSNSPMDPFSPNFRPPNLGGRPPLGGGNLGGR